MQGSKLLDLLAILNRVELEDLRNHIHYQNRSENKSVLLLDYIFQFKEDFTKPALEKSVAYSEVFKGKKYNDTSMRKCMSRLFDLCENYIAGSEVLRDEKRQQIALMAFYRERNLAKHYKGVLRNWQHSQAQPHSVDLVFFYNEFLVEREISKNIFQKQDRAAEPNLQQISQSLDNFYLMHKLKICCSSINYQLLSNTQYELPLMDELVAYLKKNEAKQPPIVCAYFYALLTLVESDNEMHFRKLSTLLFANTQTFHPDEQGDLFVLSQNYCIKRINKGDEKYLHELLELYKTGLDKGLLLKKGFLSPLDYKNIVTLGTRLQFFEWTENFIKTYSKHLNQTIRDSYYHYNLARLYFGKKDFNQVLSLLNRVDHQEVFVMLDVKVMMMKTYYELEEIEPLLSLVESFRILLSRKKSLGYHKMRYQNFLKFLRQMIRLDFNNKTEKANFKTEVEQTRQIMERDWFLEKV